MTRTVTTAIVPYQASQTMLQKLEKAKLHLAECRTFEEVKKIRDIAEAAKVYARAAHLGDDAQDYASEVSIWATHKAGGILSQLQRSKGGDPSVAAAKVAGASKYRKVLEEADVPERTAERWQRFSETEEDAVRESIERLRED